MATPHVAGICALLIEAFGPAEPIARLRSATRSYVAPVPSRTPLGLTPALVSSTQSTPSRCSARTVARPRDDQGRSRGSSSGRESPAIKLSSPLMANTAVKLK
ncbi:MAG: hypothetical protein M3Z65_04285 [Chloroflexota bacterium]|nr:hypothetical protein [Chloroflexota bacterium]